MNNMNETFNTAWENVDYQKVMNHAVRPYSKQIPYEDLNQCKCIALWECIRHFKPNKGSKFTSFLHEKTRWQCLKFFESHKIKHRTHKLDDYPYQSKELAEVDFNDLLDQLPEHDGVVLRQKYVEGKTLHEIGAANGYCYETARKKLIKAVEDLELCLES